MKKRLLPLVLLFSTGAFVTSCSDDEDMNVESLATRDYQTDSQIISKFVDFNRSTGKYFINENKRPNPISYLNDQDWQELQKVNPINYDRYEKELQELNRQLAEYEKYPNISKIVYSTYDGKTYIKDLNNDCSIHIEKVENNIPLSRARYQTLSFMQGSSPTFSSFQAGPRINSTVRINCNGNYLCELKCNTKGAQCVNNHSTVLVLSGINSENAVYSWESGSSASTLWEFTGIGKMLPFGAYAQVEFTD